eukprot:gene2437-2740_t
MSFVMPSKYTQDTLPRPNNPDVKIVEAEGLEPVGDVQLYQYHPPFTYGWQRNEFLLGPACAALARSLQLVTADPNGSQLLQAASLKVVGFACLLSLYVAEVLKQEYAVNRRVALSTIQDLSTSGLLSTLPGACCSVAAALAQKQQPKRLSRVIGRELLSTLVVVAGGLHDQFLYLLYHYNGTDVEDGCDDYAE